VGVFRSRGWLAHPTNRASRCFAAGICPPEGGVPPEPRPWRWPRFSRSVSLARKWLKRGVVTADARGESRTRTGLPPVDFEPAVANIPAVRSGPTPRLAVAWSVVMVTHRSHSFTARRRKPPTRKVIMCVASPGSSHQLRFPLGPAQLAARPRDSLARYDLQGSSDDVQPHLLRQRLPFGMLLEHTRRLPHQVDGRACDSPPPGNDSSSV
jgi:hypothetical protein